MRRDGVDVTADLGRPVTFAEAAEALRRRADDVSSTLRSGVPGSALVTELDWTLAELAAHVVSVPRIYRRTVLDRTTFVVPESMADFGQAEVEAVLAEPGGPDPARLATDLRVAVDELVETLAPYDARDESVAFYTTSLAARQVLGIALNELSMHHRDMGEVTGEAFTMTDRDVVITLDGMMTASQVFYDADVARRCPGTFDIGVRGGPHWTIEVADARVVVHRGRPSKADVRIVGEPLSLVLMSFGRTNPIGLVLRGRVVVWGTRPWKLWWLKDLFVEEVALAADHR